MNTRTGCDVGMVVFQVRRELGFCSFGALFPWLKLPSEAAL